MSDRMNDGTPGEFPPDTERAHRRPALSLTLEGAVALEGELRIRVACGPSGGTADLRLLARTDTEEPTAARFLTGQQAGLGTEATEARSEADADAEMLRWVRSLSHHAPLACAVVHPCDEGSLRGAIDAYEAGLIVPVIVAPRARIESVARAAGLSLAGTEIIDTPHSGPLAFNNAISAQAARVKGIESPVAGQAEILFVPDIEAGNVLAKQLEYWAGAASCGVVLGARVPIALTSRADPAISRVASAALAAVAARAQVKAVPGR